MSRVRDAAEGLEIRPWSQGDLPLLERLLGDSAMIIHLGGPESPAQIADRHNRYCRLRERRMGSMFVVFSDGVDLGSVGYWNRAWHDDEVWELGWSIVPEHQGRGIATRATLLAIEHARSDGAHRFAHAFPSTKNKASNAICRKIGFEHRGIVQFEYPKGHWMECVDWRFDLSLK
jgi:RimJ/RimL family protein N-acetyltransferase